MNFKIKDTVLITATLLCSAAFSAPAFSADPMLGTGGYNREFKKIELMKMLDADGNHMVTLDEFNAFNNSVFDELNKDGDDTLDATEWVGKKGNQEITVATGGYSRELRTLKMMGLMDADGDHLVTRAEFLKHQQSIFNKMDSSGDTQLNPQEWLAKHTGN